MPVATTTIRVPRATHDDLAAVARARGVSVSKLLSDQAAEWRREQWLCDEREASRAALSAPAQAEQDLWDDTDDDWD